MATKTDKAKPSKKKKDKKPGKAVAKREQKGGNYKYNWESVEKDFVEGLIEDAEKPDDRLWVNLRELSDRTDVPYGLIRARASKERWSEKRTTFQATLAKERQKNRVEYLGKRAIQFDDRALSIAERGLTMIETRMVEIIRAVQLRKEVREGVERDIQAGLPIDWKAYGSMIRSDELLTLANAAEKFQMLGMRAMGTDVDKHIFEVQGNVNHEHQVSVAAELQRDDTDRMAGVIAAFARIPGIDIAELLADDEPGDEEVDGEDIVDAEVLEDGEGENHE